MGRGGRHWDNSAPCALARATVGGMHTTIRTRAPGTGMHAAATPNITCSIASKKHVLPMFTRPTGRGRRGGGSGGGDATPAAGGGDDSPTSSSAAAYLPAARPHPASRVFHGNSTLSRERTHRTHAHTCAHAQ